MAKRDGDPAAIEAQIEQIRSLGFDALRARWFMMFKKPPPSALTKDLVARMICHRVQTEAFGGIDRATVKLLDRLTRGDQAGAELKRHLKSGTVLVREYRGERYTVTVVPGGFVWRDVTYASLSTIAREITDTSWNGPRFFGLRAASGPIDEDTEACPHQAFRLGANLLGIQFHIEADSSGIESWLIGHTVELSKAGRDPRVIRKDTGLYGKQLAQAAATVLTEWLDNIHW